MVVDRIIAMLGPFTATKNCGKISSDPVYLLGIYPDAAVISHDYVASVMDLSTCYEIVPLI